MPKKHQNRALLTKPASSAPSNLISNRAPASSSHGEPSKRTVNELIREARRVRGDDKQNIDNATLSSLPPAVRAILDMPAPAPPLPRTQLRGSGRLRRIPGPPPPRSWLIDSQHAPDDARGTFSQLRWLRARLQQQGATLPGDQFPRQDSLQHICLKNIATNWHWHAEYDNTYLSTLPVSVRETLLSYLAVYNDAYWPNPFPFLFPPDCDQNEFDTVYRLDLANSLGSWATVRKIEKELLMPTGETKTITESLKKESALETVPDSWEDEVDRSLPGPSLPSGMRSSLRFTNLKHLSLALNPASSSAPSSWSSLISLSTHLSRLVSLSLAHWPNPTYTPNAAKGRVKVVDTTLPSLPTQTYGGSDYYTAFDNNWREAAGILRSLSRNLYCLTWLDLSGCAPWLPALTWTDGGNELGADFTGSWRNLTTIIVAVGWLPGRPPSEEEFFASRSTTTSSIDSTRAIEHLYGGRQAIQESLEAIANMRLGNRRPREPPEEEVNPPWNVEHEREKQYFRRDVERYISQQNTAKQVAGEIKERRKRAGARWIEFDFGGTLNVEAMGVE
ncbi:hypothetical protein LTS08_003572 [Lithohypha guttulata]|nr:hypothetical protein LTS08_003572 [Lithohypha guttulata]